jgi:hypothetical protein
MATPSPRKKHTRGPGHRDVPRAKQPQPQPKQLHVKVKFQGCIEFDMEGPQAEGLEALLITKGITAEEIIDTLDPFSSAAKIYQDIEIHPPMDGTWRPVQGWKVQEGPLPLVADYVFDPFMPFVTWTQVVTG